MGFAATFNSERCESVDGWLKVVLLLKHIYVGTEEETYL